MNVQKLAEFPHFLSTCKSCHKTQIHHLIALKFGTQKGDVRAHDSTKFGLNTNHTESCKQLFTKNNTNMLSHLQGKMLMARS